MNSRPLPPGLSPLSILFVALALSIGWGVRGNWGHEIGAMIPGALAAMAAVLVCGRDDWHRRLPMFATFGAVGWSFGGSISYMKVIAYTHSGDGPSVFYGFACLFLIGFLWAALGGVGTALPAFLDRQRLTELLIPLLTVFVAWLAQDQFFKVYFAGLREQLQSGVINQETFDLRAGWFDWYDTDWVAVVVAAVTLSLLALARRRICWGTGLGLSMCAGWLLGFVVLTVGLGLRMTPPRGDNWSGMLGMTVATFVYLSRCREGGIAWSGLIVGLFGGLGFSGATLIKLVIVHPGFQKVFLGGPTASNYHSILEQTFGFISGVGVGLVMGYLSPRAPRHVELPPVRRWAEPVCVFFVLVVISYLNISKNLESVWLPKKDSPPGSTLLQPTMWGYSSEFWFNLGYLALAVTVTLPLVAWYRGRRLEILPSSRLGKGQLFFVVFLWWILIGNLSRYAPFHEQRLITEGLIHLNGCLCTLLAVLWSSSRPFVESAGESEQHFIVLLKRHAVAGLIFTALIVIGEFALVRGLWADTFAGQSTLHIRFGPHNTNDKK